MVKIHIHVGAWLTLYCGRGGAAEVAGVTEFKGRLGHEFLGILKFPKHFVALLLDGIVAGFNLKWMSGFAGYTGKRGCIFNRLSRVN